MLLLDTDLMTLLERDGPGAQRLRSRLSEVPPIDVATTIVNYEEQTRGWLALMASARTEPARIEAYRRLQRHIHVYSRIPTVLYDERAAAQVARMREARIRGGTMDIRIAAIAIVNDATLLSRNLTDFQNIPDLRVEDWSS